MDLATLFRQLGIALGLGLLVGLQRERVESRLAGFRTFALVTVFGTLSAQLARLGDSPWLPAAGLLALTALIALGNFLKLRGGEVDPGQTTEVALLLMYAVGVFLVVGPAPVAIAVGGGVAVLLHLKPEMHRFADRLGETDFRAVMQFALITLVILPVLPDRTYGPYDVLNPREIWLMVVLIVGIGLGGYLAYKLFGDRAGTVLAGLLGGVISSTATTVSYSRRATASPRSSPLAALVIAIAGAVVFARVLLEIAVVAPGFLPVAAPPLGLLLGVFVLVTAVAWLAGAAGEAEMPEQANPSELKPALVFAFLYALVLLAVAAAREHLGPAGLYGVAALSGLTDVDAITLSTSRLVAGGRLAPETGWRLIVLASLSNLVFKAGVVAVLGPRRLLGRVGLYFGLVAAAGGLLLALWG